MYEQIRPQNRSGYIVPHQTEGKDRQEGFDKIVFLNYEERLSTKRSEEDIKREPVGPKRCARSRSCRTDKAKEKSKDSANRDAFAQSKTTTTAAAATVIKIAFAAA